MLKTIYKMDGDLPVEISAVDENGKVHAVVSPVVPGHTDWMLSAIVDGQATGRQFEHSGPAIGAFSRYVSCVNSCILQQDAIRKAEELLAEQRAELVRREEAVKTVISLG